ncbi:DNA polymerase III subunit gamma/tau [Pararobbsia alpina]|nr:DNA polymerase III subunit gamma/tau [Pararobbsia alpina]
MTYQVLARKWRPKDFASLVGQEHVVRALTHALDAQRLHHAYLFTGTRGVGKTTLSRILAKALNCEKGITSTPCGVCNACRAIDEGRFVDYVEMDAASNRGVEEMASLLERAVYAPVDARFKVYMIDEVHMLTNHAFNAMLKTLEEPPAHVKFILATTDPQKIPVTVLSRCLQFNLKQMPAPHIVGHLEHILTAEQIGFEAQALRLLARAADGSMRDALSLTDQAIAYSAGSVGEEAVRGMLGALDQSYLVRLLDAIAIADGATVLDIADEMAGRSLSFSTALADLAGLLHRVAWAQFAPASVLEEWPEATDIRRFAALLPAEQVQLLYQIATIGRAELGLAPDEYAGFSMTLLRMLAFRPLSDRLGGAPSPSGGSSSTPPGGIAPRSSAGVGRSAAPVSALDSLADKHAMQGLPSIEKAVGERVETKPAKPSPPDVSVADTVGVSGAEPAPVLVANTVSDPAEPSAKPMSPARAALEALRSSGLRIPTDKSRASAAQVPRRPQPSTPSAPLVVPTPRRPASPPASEATGGAAPAARAATAPNPSNSTNSGADTPPWESIPDSAYEEGGYDGDAGMSSTGFDGAPSDAADEMHSAAMLAGTASRAGGQPSAATPSRAVASRGTAPGGSTSNAATATRVTEVVPKEPPVLLTAFGADVDWPAFVTRLSLRGLARELAFRSELVSVADATLELRVAVPQLGDRSHVDKLKAELDTHLGRSIELKIINGAVHYTAAAIDDARRARQQVDAERSIEHDPFIQSLIRDFGASIVPGSIRPVQAAPGSPTA